MAKVKVFLISLNLSLIGDMQAEGT